MNASRSRDTRRTEVGPWKHGPQHARARLLQGCRKLCRLVCGALSRLRRGEDAGSEVAAGWGVITVDLCEKDDRVIVSMKLPGMNRENLQIGIVSDQLTVSGERRIEQESGDGSYRIVRCAYRSFRRDMTLPHRIDAERIQTHYHDGVLHIEIPRLPEQALVTK